ncbi:MAG: Ig-like domain-containing protein, partial [Promethearchaeia archaeon]
MRANNTPLSDSIWSFTGDNISSLVFDSNQSVYIEHNMTLWYKRDGQLDSIWEVDSSGSAINWNLTTSLDYPEYIDTQGKFVNMSKMTDWTPVALYNGSSQTNHDNFTVYEDIVTCSNMTNGTWTLTLKAPNYVEVIDTYDSADNSNLTREASILLDMDINTTIADSGDNPADTGSTNLTIMHEGQGIWTSENESVVDGKTHYFWDINETTQDNGTYTLEVYWTNGTEAGYLTKEIVVFYPTSLEADRYSIDAYTESSFSIRVQFNDTYNDVGLNGSSATAKYSFDGESNQTMTDHDNGTWTADVSTVGRSPGSHTVEVFGEGFAIENQSLTISVELLHDTEPLTVGWSDGNSITYLEKTTLLVNYSLFDGTSVADARVNVTIDSNTWNLTWIETSKLYELTFNGTDDPPGLGTHSLTISAWKSGYEGQTEGDQNLTLLEEPTLLELEWYESNSITYTQSTTLRANFSISNGTPVENAWINVTIGSDTWNLTWNGTSGFYELVFNGTDEETGLGTYSLTVNASKPKYESQSTSPPDLTIDEEPTDILVTWNPTNLTIDTTEFLNLSVEYTYGGVDVPDDATVDVTMDEKTYNLLWNGSHWIVDIPGNDFSEGIYNASISAWRYGFEAKSHLTENINITLAPNAFQVFWIPEDQNITYIESVSLNVTYNHDYSPIENATVRLYLNGTLFCYIPFNESSQTYFKTIPASDITLGTWNATVIANKTGYETKQDTSYLTVNEDTPSVLPSWTSNTTDFITPIDLYVEFYASNGTPVTDGDVQVTVDSETYIGQHVSQGNYSVTIGPELEIKNNSLDLQVERYGYTNQYKTLWLNVVRASTILSVNDTGLEVYYDETVDFTIEYSMENSSIIHPANLSFLVNGENHSAVWTGSYWETTLNATLLEVGTHDCVVNVSAYGFVSKEETFQIQVSSIPTTLEIDGKTWLYVNDSLVLTLQYLDSRTSTRIEDLNPSIEWVRSHDIVQNEDLTYSLTIQSANLHVNNYSLEITFSTEGYESVLETLSIEVRRLPLSLIFNPDMEIYENETLVVTVLVNDTYHAELIDFAQVNLTIAGATYALDYDTTTESYRVSIWLNSTISPADYSVSLTASAIDCQTVEDEISLQVLAKAEYVLTAELVSQNAVITEGSALAVRATLEDKNGNPLSGKTIVFFVRMSGPDGETVESTTAVTNQEGIANAGFDVPSNTESLEVWARYEGSISEWAAEADVLTIEVRPAPSLFEVLIGAIRTPQVQIAILIAIVSFVAAIVYTKVIKPRREAGRLSLQRQLNVFKELATLQHFMAIHIEHGTCVIYFPFTEKYIEPDLISGFISAITNVYGEITGEGGVKGTLEEIHYHGLRLNSYSGSFIIGMLILEEEMSSILKRRLEFFVEMFEGQYKSNLEDWMGRVECFDPEWVLSNLISTLDYYWLLPQKITDESRIKKENKTILEFLQNNLDDKREFRIEEVLTPMAEKIGETEAETLEKLLTLQEEGAIEPISVQTLMTRRGLGL